MRAEIFHAVNDRNGVAFDVAKHDFVYESSHADSITCLWLNMKNVLELGIPAKSTIILGKLPKTVGFRPILCFNP